MKKFINLFKLDGLVTIRSGFHYVILGLAILFVVLVNFVIPESIYAEQKEIIYDGTKDKTVTRIVETSGEEIDIFDDYEMFLAEVSKERSNVGIAITGVIGELEYEIVSASRFSDKLSNITEAGLEYLTANISGLETVDDINYTVLEDEPVEIPFNKDLVPIFIALEVAMFGFLLIAVLIFQEKDERSLRAYQISPGRTMQYIWSKVTVITLLGLVYGAIVLLSTIGFKADYLSLFVIILLSSIFITLLGLTLSVFFKNISEFLIVSILTLGILQLPTISYFNPNFSPGYLSWFPSYPIMFGVRQAMFYPERGYGFLVPIVITLAVEIVIVQAACYFAVKKRLLSGGVSL